MKTYGLLVTLTLVAELVISQAILPKQDGPSNFLSIYPSAVQNRTSHAQFLSSPNLIPGLGTGLDSPKLDIINSSVTQWWYFDAVSTDLQSSLTVTFFTSTADAFPFLVPTDSVLTAYVWASFPNGTVFAEYTTANLATVATVGDGSSGIWEPIGFGWDGQPDMRRYRVTIDSREIGVKGTFELSSIAPTHYSCGPIIDNETQSLEISPHLGWTNAVPDAIGTVDFNIKGSELKFQGPAYHDQNWADAPFFSLIGSWYWGHGRLGNYSLVFFSILTPSNENYVSSYVARDGQVLSSTCNTTNLRVRPTGSKVQYPPRSGDMPQGLRIEFDLGDKEGGTLAVNITGKLAIAGVENLFTRWIGTLEGAFVGQDEPSYSGVAVFEQFTLLE